MIILEIIDLQRRVSKLELVQQRPRPRTGVYAKALALTALLMIAVLAGLALFVFLAWLPGFWGGAVILLAGAISLFLMVLHGLRSGQL